MHDPSPRLEGRLPGYDDPSIMNTQSEADAHCPQWQTWPADAPCSREIVQEVQAAYTARPQKKKAAIRLLGESCRTMPAERLPMYVLETRGLKKSYGAEGEVCVHALRGVNLQVRKGELLAIMGPSGSGKSTLLHILGGVETPTTGQVLLEGIDLATMNDDQRTIVRRERMGFIFQSFNLLPAFTAEENVALPLELGGMSSSEARKRALDSLRLVGMAHRRDHVPSAMSGGEQQRVAIARALVIRPALLLADEPTGNLDSANGRQVTALLRRLCTEDEQTIVMVTHDAKVAAQADRLVRLRDGLEETEEDMEAAEMQARVGSGRSCLFRGGI
jgi:putative ABC transport system ATP-binding protein